MKFVVDSLPFNGQECLLEGRCPDADTDLCPKQYSGGMGYDSYLKFGPENRHGWYEGIYRGMSECRHLAENCRQF